MAKKEEVADIVGGFTKAQFLQSRQWEGIDKDILSTVLEDDKTYTLADAIKLVNDFKNREVK